MIVYFLYYYQKTVLCGHSATYYASERGQKRSRRQSSHRSAKPDEEEEERRVAEAPLAASLAAAPAGKKKPIGRLQRSGAGTRASSTDVQARNGHRIGAGGQGGLGKAGKRLLPLGSGPWRHESLTTRPLAEAS